METVKELLVILISSSLVSNVVLSQFLGLCPFLGVSRKTNTAAGMGTAVIFVITLSSAVTGAIYEYILKRFHVEYLETIVFILVIAALVQFVEIVLKKFIPALHKSLGVYLPLITTNCAVLGVAINNITDGYNFIESMASSLGVGIGFWLAMVLFAGVRSRIENSPAPRSFKGLPVTLVAAAIVSLAFFGFTGVVEGLLDKIFPTVKTACALFASVL